MSSSVLDILLVEDNPNDVELTLRAFRQKNLTNNITVVNDGIEALDFLFRRGKYQGSSEITPRLILLDLKLPKVDGIEVLSSIKSHDQLRKIPVVILTSSREEPDIKTCYQLGANSYIVKPVDFDKFIDAVCELGLYWLLLNEPPH